MAILIVDDMELNRRMLSAILEDKYEIIEAGNGLQALKILRDGNSQVSLIMLDIAMPVMDGFEFIQRVKQEQLSDIPIVFVTAEANEKNVIKGIREGVCDIIAKPYDPYLIQNRIRRLLELHQCRVRSRGKPAGAPRQEEEAPRRAALVVDDMEINRVLLRAALEKQYEVLLAENGLQALELLEGRQKDIAVVLLDIIMPVMDGIQMMGTARRRKLLQGVPVIAITAEESPTKLGRVKELGICEIIPKPFNPAIVKNRVNNMVELYAKRQEA